MAQSFENQMFGARYIGPIGQISAQDLFIPNAKKALSPSILRTALSVSALGRNTQWYDWFSVSLLRNQKLNQKIHSIHSVVSTIYVFIEKTFACLT